jgi:ubiquinone/menaquinone biosynthesis C-methylase UbiE
MPVSSLNERVRSYWEAEPCGTDESIAGGLEAGTREWYERIEEHRYAVEPFIHQVAQFTRHRGKRVLEVGVGAGTDHLQWARAGCECFGVDLTDAAIETTRARLACYGLESRLQRVDAELLPYADATFDIVYSWGVIHHSERPEQIAAEIRRVLKPGGMFIGMVYGRRSLLAFKLWIRHALLKGRPWRSPAALIWNYVESVGTKAYTSNEVRRLLTGFSSVALKSFITTYDTVGFPRCLWRLLPDDWGWFVTFKAVR